MPALLPPFVDPLALVDVVAVCVAVSTSAVVSLTTTLTAIEPATPTLLPPAPETECAEKDELPLPGDFASSVVDVAVRFVFPATYAFVVSVETATATAMPM